MTEQELDKELIEIANKYGAMQLKLRTTKYDRNYVRNEYGNMELRGVKAIIRTLGKVSVVSIGEGHEFSTYEEAFEATKKRWSEYYKKVRANWTDKEKADDARRQKRYREKQKALTEEFKRRQ